MKSKRQPALQPPELQPRLKPYYLGQITRWTRFRQAALLVALTLVLTIYGFYYALTTPWMLVPFAAPLAGMMFIVIWALPDLRAAPTRTMERMFFAMTAVMFLWPNYLAFAFSGLPWISLIRLTGIPMFLLFLVCLSVSQAFRRQLADVLSAAPPLWKAVLGFGVIVGASVGLSNQPAFSASKAFIVEIYWIGTFFISAYVFSKPGRAERWGYVLWISALGVSAIGVLETRQHQIPWAGHLPPFLRVDPLVADILKASFRSAIDLYRTKGTFNNPLALAEFLALALPFVMHLAFGEFSRTVKWFALASIPVAFFTLEATGSRLGMVGSGIGILAYSFMWAIKRWRKNRTAMMGPALVLAYPALATLLTLASFVYRPLRQRVWGGGATAASDAGREAQLEAGLRKLALNPIGNGIGRAAEILGFRGTNDKLTIDNYYVAVALDFGVLGFVVHYGMFLYAIILALRGAMRPTNSRDVSFLMPCTAALAAFFVIKWVFAQTDNHTVVYMMLGAVVGLLWQQQRLEPPAAVDHAATATVPRRRRPLA